MKEHEIEMAPYEDLLNKIASEAIETIDYCVYQWIGVNKGEGLHDHQSMIVEWVWNSEKKKYLPSEEFLSMILSTGIISQHMTGWSPLDWKYINRFVKEKIAEEIYQQFWRPNQTQKIRMSNIIENPLAE